MVSGGSVRPARRIGRLVASCSISLRCSAGPKMPVRAAIGITYENSNPNAMIPANCHPRRIREPRKRWAEQGRRGEQAHECVRPEVEAEAGQPEYPQHDRVQNQRRPRDRQREQDEDRHRVGDTVFPQVEETAGVGELDPLGQEEDDRTGADPRQNRRNHAPPPDRSAPSGR